MPATVFFDLAAHRCKSSEVRALRIHALILLDLLRLAQADEFVDYKGLHRSHRRKNGQLCNRKWSVELFTFTEVFCSDECEALHCPNMIFVEGKDRLVYSTVNYQADIQKGYLVHLD